MNTAVVLQGAMALFSKYCKQSTPITVRFLAIIIRSKHSFEYADSSPVVVSRDLMSSERNTLNTMPGPIESPGKGSITANLR